MGGFLIREFPRVLSNLFCLINIICSLDNYDNLYFLSYIIIKNRKDYFLISKCSTKISWTFEYFVIILYILFEAYKFNLYYIGTMDFWFVD